MKAYLLYLNVRKVLSLFWRSSANDHTQPHQLPHPFWKQETKQKIKIFMIKTTLCLYKHNLLSKILMNYNKYCSLPTSPASFNNRHKILARVLIFGDNPTESLKMLVLMLSLRSHSQVKHCTSSRRHLVELWSLLQIRIR